MTRCGLQGVLALSLVLASSVGCVSKDTVTENDRVMEGHLLQQADMLDKLGDAVMPVSAPLGTAIKGIAADMRLEAGQLVANHGPAKNQTPYTTANAQAAAAESKKEHATPWWQTTLYIATGVLLTVLGVKTGTSVSPAIASRFAGPWGMLGQVGIDVAGRILEKFHTGQPVNAAVVEDTLLAHADDVGIKPLVQQQLVDVKAKLGVTTPTPDVPPAVSAPAAGAGTPGA